MGAILVTQTISIWAMYFYVPPPGVGLPTRVPVEVFGLIMVLGRIVDAVTDPLVGFLSDRSRSKWGRRIPLIVAGTPLLCLFFFLIWTPPMTTSSTFNIFYIAVVLNLLFLSYTLVLVAYWALLPEIAPSPEERVKLSAWQSFFNIVALFASMAGSSFLVSRLGFRAMGLIVAIVSFISFYAPVAVIREKADAFSQKDGLNFATALGQTLKNGPFLIYILSYMFFWFGLNLVITGAPYLVTVVLAIERPFALTFIIISLISVAIGFFLAPRLTVRFGQKNLLITTVALLCFFLPMIFFLGKEPTFYIKIIAEVLAALAFISYPSELAETIAGFINSKNNFLMASLGVMGLPVIWLFILPNTIISDIIDYDEKKTGLRREAMYFGVQGFILKLTVGTSSFFLSSLLFKFFGYSSANPLGIHLIGPFAGLSMLIGLIIFLRFPLSGGRYKRKDS